MWRRGEVIGESAPSQALPRKIQVNPAALLIFNPMGQLKSSDHHVIPARTKLARREPTTFPGPLHAG
jgi:hypothetical protein